MTIEIIDMAAMRFLRDLAAISLIRLPVESKPSEEEIIAQINAVCREADTSLDPGFMAAQMEILEDEDW